MESLFHIKCHRIIDHHKVEVVVVIVVCFLKKDIFVVSGEQEESEILMYATNGDNDTSRDR